MTDRLYYDDSYLERFRARVVDREGDRVYLDRSAFYPTSGGQPFDTGTIAGARVEDVIDEGHRVAHVVKTAFPGDEVDCAVDWPRRFDHMQQHSGQHLLSGVLHERFGIATVSFHMSADISTIDLETDRLDAATMNAAELHANGIVTGNRPVTVGYRDAGDQDGLRKSVDRGDRLRIVTIDGLDRSACGGTHVRATGEIGAILLRKLDKVRGKVRLEFVCGARAIRQARNDYESLSAMARFFSCGLLEAPEKAAAHAARLAEAERERRKLRLELAAMRGRELHAAMAANAAGLRVHVRRMDEGGLEEAVRAEAQAFTACERAVFIAAAAGWLLLAVSPDCGVQAGAALKPVLEKHGGRGGGGPAMAQGSIPGGALDSAVSELTELFR